MISAGIASAGTRAPLPSITKRSVIVAAVPPRAVPERPRADAPTLDLTPAQPFALDMNVDDEMVRALRDMCRANRQGSPGSWAC